MTPVAHGLVRGLPIEKYHQGSSISKTGLDDIHRSPAHYYARHLDPKRPPREPKPSQIAGNLAHTAVLEPAEFDRRYAVGPDASRATKDWKAWESSLPVGTLGIKQEQRDIAIAQRDSVHALQNVWNGMSAREMLAASECEISAFWSDPSTGVPCRCRPDAVYPLNARQCVLLDLKTFGDARPREFSKQVHSMRYHVQDAFYSEGFAAASGLEVLGFVFLVVEDKWPFAAASYRLGPDSRYEGLDQSRQLLETYAECVRSNTWPGYANTTTVIDLPPYALTPQEVEISYA